MRIAGIWIILLGVSMGVMGCAAGPQLNPVTNQTQRLEFEGFSILPPHGENWFSLPSARLKQLGPYWIASFYKMPAPRSKGHTITAWVRAGRLPIAIENRAEFLQNFPMVNFAKTERHRPVLVNISPDRTLAADCVRYDGMTEDRGVPGHQGSVFIWDQHGFACLHPDLPNTFIEIQYSQRRPQADPPMSLEAEGEPFLKSLAFNKLPGR